MKSTLDNRDEFFNRAVLSSVLNNFCKKENVKGMKDLILYRYDSAIRVTLVLQNIVSINCLLCCHWICVVAAKVILTVGRIGSF